MNLPTHNPRAVCSPIRRADARLTGVPTFSIVHAVGAGSRRVAGADWAAIVSLMLGLAALCTLVFLLFFSGPIESAFVARLPCPLPVTTNECFATHPEYYRWEIGGPFRKEDAVAPRPSPGIASSAQPPKTAPSGNVLINDPQAVFGYFWSGSLIAAMAALVLSVLALRLSRRLGWVAWSGVMAGGSTLVILLALYVLSQTGD